MKQIIIISGLLLFLFSSCNTETMDYDKAVQADSPEAFESFLIKYPGSQYTVSAREKLDSLRYIKLNYSDNYREYEQFLKNYPESEYNIPVKIKYDSLLLVHILRVNQIDTFRNYLLNNPDSRFRDLISQKIESLSKILLIDIRINQIWHNFLTKAGIREQIYNRLDSVLKKEDFILVNNSDFRYDKDYWGEITCSYSETSPFRYLNDMSATKAQVNIRLKTRSGIKTTWSDINGAYCNPATLQYIQYNGEKMTSEKLRKTSSDAVWQEIPMLIIPTGNFKDAEAKVKEVPVQKYMNYHSSGNIPQGKFRWKINNITHPWLAGKKDTLFFFQANQLIAYFIPQQKILWKHQLKSSDSYELRQLLERFDNKILLGTQNYVIAIDCDKGIEMWRFKTDTSWVESIKSTPFGILAACLKPTSGRLLMINPDNGKILWRREVGERIEAMPAMNDDILYYFDKAEDLNVNLFKIALSNGDIIDKKPLEQFLQNSESDAWFEKDVLVMNNFKSVRAFDVNSLKIKWEFNTDAWINSNYIVHKNVLYFTTTGGSLYALHMEDGKVLWEVKYKEKHISGAILDFSISIVDGVLYVPSETGHLFWFDAETGRSLWFEKISSSIQGGGPIIQQGNIFIIANQSLYCYN